MGYRKRLPEVRVKLCESGYMYSAEPIRRPEDAVLLLRSEMCELDREAVFVVNIDNKNKPINYHCVSLGGLSESLFEVSNIFKTAILSNAKAIIIAHNHPSGDPSPSAEDFAATERVKKASEVLGIPLLDHVIVGGRNYYSFKENGVL